MLTTPHIQVDDRSVAWIDHTNTKVIEVALDMIAHTWRPEAIHSQHPHLSLVQIHAAMGHCYDHQVDLDAQIECSVPEAAQLREQSAESPLRLRLRAMGRLA